MNDFVNVQINNVQICKLITSQKMKRLPIGFCFIDVNFHSIILMKGIVPHYFLIVNVFLRRVL